MLFTFLAGAISMGVIYLYACLGETIIEKVGNLNLGIPGIMCLGALGGAIGVNVYYSLFGENVIGALLIIIAIIFSMLFAAIGGLIYSFLTVSLQANQNVTGLALTTFGAGLMRFIGSSMDVSRFPGASLYFKTGLSLNIENSFFKGLCDVLFNHGVLVYLSFILAILITLVVYRSRVGLYIRAIGESPQTADSQGIDVARYKYLCIIIGSGIAGIGGLYYVFDRSGGTTFVEAAIEAFGWMSVALVIFSMWKPFRGALGSILFGGLYILPQFLPISNIQLKIFAILPYVVTVIVLIFTSIFDRKDSQPPRSLGINYFREER